MQSSFSFEVKQFKVMIYFFLIAGLFSVSFIYIIPLSLSSPFCQYDATLLSTYKIYFCTEQIVPQNLHVHNIWNVLTFFNVYTTVAMILFVTIFSHINKNLISIILMVYGFYLLVQSALYSLLL